MKYKEHQALANNQLIISVAKEMIKFLGNESVTRLLRYAKKTEVSGAIEKRYFHDSLHPWLAGIKKITNTKKVSPLLNEPILDEDILTLATDSYLLMPVLNSPQFPNSIKGEYRSRLSDPRRARDAIFELRVASFYHSFTILDWTNPGIGKRPEFAITWEGNKAYLECKQLEQDTGLLYSNSSFQQLSDIISKNLIRKQLHGNIQIVLNEKLPTSYGKLIDIWGSIDKSLKESLLKGSFTTNYANVYFDLKVDSSLIYLDSTTQQLAKDAIPKNGTGILLITEEKTNPLTISLISQNKVPFLEKIGEKLSEAKTQIPKNEKGIAFINLKALKKDDLEEFTKLPIVNSFFNTFFEKERSINMIAVVLMSGPFIIKFDHLTAKYSHYDAACYRNNAQTNQEYSNFPLATYEKPIESLLWK